MLERLLRTIAPVNETKRQPVSRCHQCGHATKNGKSLCVEHITEGDYPMWIASVLKSSEHEAERVLKTRSIRSIKSDSLLLKDILTTLHTKSRTIKSLAKDMLLPYDLVEVYARYLLKNKVAALRPTKKGDDHYIDLLIVPDAFKEPEGANPYY